MALYILKIILLILKNTKCDHNNNCDVLGIKISTPDVYKIINDSDVFILLNLSNKYKLYSLELINFVRQEY